MEVIRNLPIGIQSFREIIVNKCIYADKTRFVYDLAKQGKPYFLSRPRRFGKSLFVSTLKAYFLGQQELFRGLDLEHLEPELAEQQCRSAWQIHPVIHFDFSLGDYTTFDNFKSTLDSKLSEYEQIYGCTLSGYAPPAIRFANIITAAKKQSGLNTVVLIDEYDKPLLNNIADSGLTDRIRAELKSFYGVIKACDDSLRLVFITGVTKFDRISIFSDLNSLTDISMNERFNAICGITQQELEATFRADIEQLAASEEMTYEECLAELKNSYDGYHFSAKSLNEGIYNPFSVMNAFSRREFGNCWFTSGTPTSLVRMIQSQNMKISSFDNDIEVSGRSLEEYRLDSANPIPMMYQSGYLTIKHYDRQSKLYTLGFPNNEVRYSFLNFLLPMYTATFPENQVLNIWQFRQAIYRGDVETFMARIQDLTDIAPKPTNQKYYELNIQQFIWVIFTLMGEFILCEVKAGDGICDAAVWTEDNIYLFEFKINRPAQEALDQINSRNYAIQFEPEGKTVVKIGACFDTQTGKLQWITG